MLASRNHAHLIIIDIQQRLAPAIHEAEVCVANAGRLIQYANRFDIPVTLTEQMPDRIGATRPDIRALAPPDAVCITKTAFSALREPMFHERVTTLRHSGRGQIVVAGMEAHVCVLQTVMDLLAAEHDVRVVADAIGSRNPDNRALAIDRMSKAGASIVSHEMIAFEWLERADTPEFKDLLPLFK